MNLRFTAKKIRQNPPLFRVLGRYMIRGAKKVIVIHNGYNSDIVEIYNKRDELIYRGEHEYLIYQVLEAMSQIKGVKLKAKRLLNFLKELK